ncbi:hypothetical protein PUNSTDRAFT_141986 [Punctularia strigosozonata HHB-11173 SS5]|uniref:uncharacterized protein n=1 Tax=Punctularia strigosozonata (strain HHB-11173) TaxID=741275 RepID=UPI0004418065|nr:uncharacterized protein PUNSTDRAFT_141986 [Punctularia strigosozonata HHB-11173 SS5]EIN11716.1 hypothetical protein PUNSTDRAFT_141986 [Punctularia strigosozonata HHB-11173 SS5]
MPPMSGSKAAAQPSRELVTTGPKAVSKGKGFWAGTRDKDGRKPTTSRALVLRNGKYGSMGTGELVLMNRMSGREKLELLAEDLVEKAKTAIAPPFDLERCLKTAESEYNAYLDDISKLKDPSMFRYYIDAELKARRMQTGTHIVPEPARIAETVMISVHNAYMFASIWKIVRDLLLELHELGLASNTVARNHLKKDPELRARYLVLYDVVSALVQAGQENFRFLVTTTPHYQQYFNKVDHGNSEEQDVSFDWGGLKGAYKSFLDSIILELCLPNSSMPRRILLQILGEAASESPKEAKRFPQALWDAVGDLSVMVDVLEMLEGPLLGGDSKAWMEEPRQMPEVYSQWEDAQLLSLRASREYKNLEDLVYPLEKTTTKGNLDILWTQIDNNYVARAGDKVEELWRLHGALVRSPQWNAFYKSKSKAKSEKVPTTSIKRHTAGSDSDDDEPPNMVSVVRRGGNGTKKRLALTSGQDDDSDSSMPSLLSVSESADEESSDEDDDPDDYYDDDDDWEDDDDESQYDSDDEEEIRHMMREAMNTAMEMPEFLDPKAEPSGEFDKLAKERVDNPFLKLLGSLRGRMFSTKPSVTTTSRTQPRTGFTGTGPATVPRPKQTANRQHARRGSDEIPPLESIPSAHASRKATVEEVEDEDQIAAKKKKKKKKPKKKKSTAVPATDVAQNGESAQAQANRPATPPPRTPSPQASISPQPGLISPQESTPTKKKKKKSGQGLTSSSAPTVATNAPSIHSLGSTTTLAGASTVTLPLYQTQTAQSSRAYVKEQGLDEKKEKVKTRRDPATLPPVPEKKSIFDRFRKAKDKIDETPNKEAKSSFFSKLGKKTTTYMHQLLRTAEDDRQGQAGMKWENFVKLMTDMGFTYDPSTAGSSVRFDPPDPTATPITFHKPHPDPTIHRIMLRDFAKRLQEYYGWSEEDFVKFTGV